MNIFYHLSTKNFLAGILLIAVSVSFSKIKYIKVLDVIK